MEFIRQVGNQAEVNDGGKIRRLPFSGEGVAPQPGARVNPVRDACCCPGAVPLAPHQVKEALRGDPRRTFNGKTKEIFNFCCDNYMVDTDIVKNVNKILVYPVDTFFLPLPELWIQYDSREDKFIIKRFTNITEMYTHCSSTFGSIGDSQLTLQSYIRPLIERLISLGTPERVMQQITQPQRNPERLKTKFFIYDVGGNERDSISKTRYSWVERFSTIHPKSQIHIMYVNRLLEGFKTFKEMERAWFKKPNDNRFKYERLY